MEPAKRLFIRAVEFMRVPIAEIMAHFSFGETVVSWAEWITASRMPAVFNALLKECR